MTFKELYQEAKAQPYVSPGRAFILAIAANTSRDEKTVRQWLCGSQEPPFEIKLKISKLIQRPVEELFPIKQRK